MHNPRHDDMPPCYEDLVAPSGVTSGAAAALASVHALLSAAVALASTARSISRREKKGQWYKGSFFIWVCATGTHATSPPQCHPRRGRWASAMLCCGAVLGLGQSAALPSLSTADAIRTRRPWLGSQPWARRASKPLANAD